MGTAEQLSSWQNRRELVYLVYPVDILCTPGIFKDWVWGNCGLMLKMDKWSLALVFFFLNIVLLVSEASPVAEADPDPLNIDIQVLQRVGDSGAGCRCTQYPPVPEHYSCVITIAAPPHHACKCTCHFVFGLPLGRCTAEVVDCKDPNDPHCKHPDTTYTSCLQAEGGNCLGYIINQ